MTELGEIPSEWAISKIGELTEIKTGGTPSTKCEKYWKDGDIPWMASGDVNKKIINEVDGRITKSGMENSAAKLLPKDTVMIALNGQGKTKGTVAYLNIELTCNQSLAGFLPSYNVFNSKYLYYNLQSRYFEIRGLAGDGARNGLNLGLLREILIPIPSIKEQEKIASILSTVDEQIDNVDALIEKNKELKKGLMQTLLTKGIGHTKFKKTEIGEVPSEWYIKSIDEITKEVYRYPTYYGIEYVEEGIAEIRGELLNDDASIKKESFRYISEKTAKKFPRTKLEGGDIVISVRGTIGKVGYITEELAGSNITANLLRVSMNRNIMNEHFVKQLFLSDIMKRKFDEITTATTIKTFKVPEFKQIILAIPTKDEQDKIASILLEVDKKIEEHENKKQKLEELKKGLMQQLLTGRIRV